MLIVELKGYHHVGFFAAVFLPGLYGDIAGLFTGVHVHGNMTVAYNDAITFGLCSCRSEMQW